MMYLSTEPSALNVDFCCAQHLPTRGKEDVYMYTRPTLLPEAALPPETTLPPGACLAEPVRTGE
jgi:hypothetical protein